MQINTFETLYSSSRKMGIPGQVALNDPAQNLIWEMHSMTPLQETSAFIDPTSGMH